jgi:dienelactone hydrolase
MAKSRPVNLYDALQGWLKTRKPDCAFQGSTRADFLAWKRAFRTHYRRCLGPWPEEVPLRLDVVDRAVRGDHVREKVLFDSSPGVTVPAYILSPKGLRRGERRPGILACHGHGNGKDDVVGVTRESGDADKIKNLERLNYEYGLEAVGRGYVVIAPDWCPFGERRPPPWWCRPNRDPCNITDLAWLYFGRPLITQSIWDGMRCVDVLCRRPDVDPRRLGVLGLSQGGTMTTHLFVNDRRLKAAVVSGYISTVRGDALGERGKGNTCGAQHVPGLLLHGDIPDVLGLAAPRPAFFEMGEQETCFHFPDMIRAYRHLQRIYRAADAAERIGCETFPTDHRWRGNKAWEWLERWL